MRRFLVERNVDVSGVSGIGIVAEGVEFSDGICVMHWLGDRASTAIYPSMTVLSSIHGHGGATIFVYVDQDE